MRGESIVVSSLLGDAAGWVKELARLNLIQLAGAAGTCPAGGLDAGKAASALLPTASRVGTRLRRSCSSLVFVPRDGGRG